jgi:hypothetical protein
MNRFTSKHVYLTPNCISSRLHWLLLCIFLIPITGCFVARATPDTWNLEIQNETPPPLPNLSLVRRVVPEVGTKSYTGWSFRTNNAVPVESESRFGDQDEEADLSCVYAGLKEASPDIDIIPTTTFWEQIAARDDAIELPELFVIPQSNRLQEFQADVMVIAYHSQIDLETVNMFAFIEAFFKHADKETAAIIVIDLRRQAIIHGSKISFEDADGFGWMIIPIGRLTLDPPDICNTVGRQAGAAIAEAMPGRKVRALVVVAGEDPYEVVNTHLWSQRTGSYSPM